MRRALLAVTIVGLVMAPAAGARTLPSLFAGQIRKIDAAAHAPDVLLPRSMPLDAKRLYPNGGPTGSSYVLAIGVVKHCGGADACFVAEFTASKARTVFGKRVKVRGAAKAGFTPLSCGASCAPPQIDFLVHGFRYTIQANLKRTSQGDKATLIAAAQAAIKAGPR
ncbi:MAG TPA: hypothetical protein VGL51_17330 [Solirubrobacteraceae bacterium]|jgi:hypothetical protein